MSNKNAYEYILDQLPYSEPFLFVDELQEVEEDGVMGTYTYSADSSFYKGHFKDHPVTPGVILTETMAQIGVVCLGIYINNQQKKYQDQLHIAMTSSEVEYLLPVYPSEKVQVTSEKIYYRFGKLKCKVIMKNIKGEIVCQGHISGMTIVNKT
jgi:3-hydroxyacyl-[acyl-carrier-protein] dehydratase